ncbi:hypothetical protein QYE76_030747 [Lolium multiflorum]|uniref:CCHC-type domain-containing protein n=1 Tax=Lolium multiflorum TaxID=4521 RepID=A0AAD8QS41_LOLMU|nr:hypothetical protein QYE76_030747 [Lolium multiflorum]
MAEQENGENGFLPGEQSPPPSIVDSTPATLDDLKKLESSIVSQFKAMMMELIAPKSTSKASVDVPPPQVNTLPLVDFVAQSTKPPRERELEDIGTSSKGKDMSPVAGQLIDIHAVFSPSDHALNVPIPMPCILPHGSPPLLLDYNRVGDWKFLMRSYVRSASTELWRIIEEGYSPRDQMNLTRREVVDNQLNAIAINMIHLAITPKDRAHICSLKTAKEAWDKLDMLFLKRRRSRSSCYNCGDKRHLVAECIYERRDEHDGKLVCKSEFGPLSKGLSKLSSNNNVIKISSTKKSRTNMQGDQDHSVDKLKAKKCHLEEKHERSLEDVATFAKKKGDEGPSSCCDKLLDEVCLLRRHNAKFMEVISTQEKALNEYYHLSKEKMQCCDHEEEIATLKKHEAKLFEVNKRQNESLLEWNRLSKDIASLEKHKCLLLRRNSLLEEALLDHEDEVNHLKSEIESLQVQVQFLEGVIEAYGDLCNEGGVAIMPRKIERERRINEKKNVKIGPIVKWAPISNS